MTNAIRTFTPEQFEQFLARPDWQRGQNQDIVDRLMREVDEYNPETDDLDLREIPHAYGWAALTSTLDGVSITYTESFNFDVHDEDSLSIGTEGQDEIWRIEGVRIVDEDGDERDPEDWLEDGAFTAIDYGFLDSEFSQTEDVDMDGDSDIITLQIDNAPSLRFRGELIASASSSANNARSDYSGSTGRWTELALYRTVGGKFVCHQVGHTQWTGEHTRYKGAVCETTAEVVKFFGHGWLAKDLYDEAGIEDVRVID